MNKYLILLVALVFFASCSEFQKALKSEDAEIKIAVASKLFQAKKYSKAIKLYEQLASTLRGRKEANVQEMYYQYAQSLYNTKQYYISGYQFDSFASSYPKSEKVEECIFLACKSYSELSPTFSLDQVDTEKALTKLQSFIDKYPSSNYIAEANLLSQELTNKLEKKYFLIAKQYVDISDYKSGIKALDNFLNDYPGSIYKEKVLYNKFVATYELAINSVEYKMEERLKNAIEAHTALVNNFSGSEYKEEVDKKLTRIQSDLQKFSK